MCGGVYTGVVLDHHISYEIPVCIFSLYFIIFFFSAVYMCKLSEMEHPLYLRLVAGPRSDMLSFVLREHETGEVLVSCICAPTVQGLDLMFLRMQGFLPTEHYYPPSPSSQQPEMPCKIMFLGVPLSLMFSGGVWGCSDR